MKSAVAFAILAVIATVFAQCVISERDALLNIYTATGGATWTTNTNWGVGAFCANNWFGIVCNKDGNVIGIELTKNNLVGPLTADIGCFPFLKTLQMAENQLAGPIPAAIGDLLNLQYLNLEHNLLNGPLPAELCLAEHLQYIYLGFNLLESTIPVCYTTAFDFVKEIHVECNQLTGILPDFRGYDYLTEVRSRCNLFDEACPAWTLATDILVVCDGPCADCPVPPVVLCPEFIENACGVYQLVVA